MIGIGFIELAILLVLGLVFLAVLVSVIAGLVVALRRKSLPCPHCGGPASPGTAFCASCGKSLTPV